MVSLSFVLSQLSSLCVPLRIHKRFSCNFRVCIQKISSNFNMVDIGHQEGISSPTFFMDNFSKLFLYASNLLTLSEWGEQEGFSISFSPVTLTNVGISTKIFLSFSFNPLFTLVKNFKSVASTGRKLLNLNQNHLSKKLSVLVKFS